MNDKLCPRQKLEPSISQLSSRSRHWKETALAHFHALNLSFSAQQIHRKFLKNLRKWKTNVLKMCLEANEVKPGNIFCFANEQKKDSVKYQVGTEIKQHTLMITITKYTNLIYYNMISFHQKWTGFTEIADILQKF